MHGAAEIMQAKSTLLDEDYDIDKLVKEGEEQAKKLTDDAGA